MTDRDADPIPGGDVGAPDGPELERVWELLEGAAAEPASPEQTDAAWTAVSERLGLAGERAGDPTRGTAVRGRARPAAATAPGRWTWTLRAAAVAAAALIGASAWYQLPVSTTAAPGEQKTVALPDGSRATLNAGSTLRHRRGFALLPGLAAAERSVRLEGEAFFDVATAERPFAVNAGRLSVQVLGTRFNVRARPGSDGRAQVMVEEGRVRVTPIGVTGEEDAAILSHGDVAWLAPGSTEIRRGSVRPERVGVWRKGGLTVVDEPLAAVLAELSLRFGVPVALSDTAVRASRITVFYPEAKGLETILADLTTQQELSYRRTAEGWEVF